MPMETALTGMPGVTDLRSLSIFGLSDIKFYFAFGTDYFKDRQEALNRLAMMTFPESISPTLSPWSAIAEIYRYELVGDGVSPMDLNTIQACPLPQSFHPV